MAEQDWEITIYEAAGDPKSGKRFAVVTVVGDKEPTVELVDTAAQAETVKARTHELLWRAKEKMFE